MPSLARELFYAAQFQKAERKIVRGDNVLSSPNPFQRKEESARKRELHKLKSHLMSAIPQLQDYASDESFPLHEDTAKMMTVLVDWCLRVDEELGG